MPAIGAGILIMIDMMLSLMFILGVVALGMLVDHTMYGGDDD